MADGYFSLNGVNGRQIHYGVRVSPGGSYGALDDEKPRSRLRSWRAFPNGEREGGTKSPIKAIQKGEVLQLFSQPFWPRKSLAVAARSAHVADYFECQ